MCLNQCNSQSRRFTLANSKNADNNNKLTCSKRSNKNQHVTVNRKTTGLELGYFVSETGHRCSVVVEQVQGQGQGPGGRNPTIHILCPTFAMKVPCFPVGSNPHNPSPLIFTLTHTYTKHETK